MGVRESAAGISPDETNIRDFVIEEKETAPLPPIADLYLKLEEEADKHWEDIRDGILEENRAVGGNHWVNLACGAKLLFPERAAEEYGTNSDSELRLLKFYKEQKRFDDRYLSEARELIILFPEKAKEMELASDEAWQGAKAILEENHKLENWRNFFTMAAEAKIVFPKKTNEDLFLDVSARKAAYAQLQEDSNLKRGFYGFFGTLRDVKILFPDSAGFKLSNQIVKRIDEQVESWKSVQGWRKIAGRVSDIKIAAAEEIIIDENGLRCVMPEAKTRLSLKDKPRPVRRAY